MQIAVVGAGTMGADIAQAVALGQHSVILHDVDDTVLRRALARASRGIDQAVQRGKLDPFLARRAKRRFRLTSDIHQCAAADLVIEAVYDDPDLKQSVLRALDKAIRPDAILATTTNTLSVTRLAAGSRLPERVIGLHFLNPAHIMRLVEVVRSDRTQPDVIERAMAFVRTIHKSPVLLDDVPGLIVNRVAMAYFGEALRLLDDVGLEVETVDRLMEAAGFPMGPFRLMDFVGVDTIFEVSLAMWEATFHDVPYRPHPRIQRMVEAGLTGRGERGFYDGAGT
jgi:3-hydroxybutyryl-CoA dehydrogenase